VADKAKAVLARGLTPIVCVGETLGQREQGTAQATVKRQLSAVIHDARPLRGRDVVAYEPVWAIGTGVVATPEQAQEMHALIRAQLRARHAAGRRHAAAVRRQHEARQRGALLSQQDIDGGLIGGAALKAADFVAICRAAG
jgi:triosephosphate isomerase